MKTQIRAGDDVKFIQIFPLAPYDVYDMLGEIGTAVKFSWCRTEKKSWKVWLVKFEDRQLWIKESGLELC